MTSSTLDHPAKVEMVQILIDGEDVIGLFVSIELFENIFLGGVTGSITIFDTDGLNFIEKNQIEFIEEISFTFRNASGVELTFEGYMNGLRDEKVFTSKKMYVIDFTSRAVRNNEMNFINRAFRDENPQEIVREMVEGGSSQENLGSTLIMSSKGTNAENMTWVSGTRKPLDVIRFVLNHAISKEGDPQYDEEQATATGASGFLCWETLDGYRFSSMNNLTEEGNFSQLIQTMQIT